MTISWGRWLGLAALWIPVGISAGFWVANADRGLQMTDEASYLLIAQDPWNMGGHTSFYGFLLHPLWVLSGGHVGPFRLAGFFILVVAAVFLGQSVRLVSGRSYWPGFLPTTPMASAPLTTTGLLWWARWSGSPGCCVHGHPGGGDGPGFGEVWAG